MYVKSSLLCGMLTPRLCRYGYSNSVCGNCSYRLSNEVLLNSISLRHIILLIASLLRCTTDETIAIKPETITINCNGTISYDIMRIDSAVKHSMNHALSICVLDMWTSICPFAREPTVASISRSLRHTINSSTRYVDLVVSVQFIVDNFDTWSLGSISMGKSENSSSSHAA